MDQGPFKDVGELADAVGATAGNYAKVSLRCSALSQLSFSRMYLCSGCVQSLMGTFCYAGINPSQSAGLALLVDEAGITEPDASG